MTRRIRCPACGGSLKPDMLRCVFRCRDCGKEFSCQYMEDLLMGKMSDSPDDCMKVIFT